MFGGHRPCGRRKIKFSIFRVTSHDHVIRGSLWMTSPHHKWPLWQVWWPLALQKRNYFDLICHVTSYDHVVRGLFDIMGEFALIISPHPAKFGCHRRSATEEISFFIYHVTWRYFVVRELCDIRDEFPLSLGDINISIYHLTSRDHIVRGSGDIITLFSSL